MFSILASLVQSTAVSTALRCSAGGIQVLSFPLSVVREFVQACAERIPAAADAVKQPSQGDGKRKTEATGNSKLGFPQPNIDRRQAFPRRHRYEASAKAQCSRVAQRSTGY